MAEIKVSVISFLFREELKSLQGALDSLPFFEKKNLKSSNEVLLDIKAECGTLVLASLVDKNDLIEIATLVKMSKKIPKDASYKIIVVNFSKNQAFEKAIENLGIKDVLEPTLNTKAYKFKLDLHYKNIASKLKRETTQNVEKTIKSEKEVKEETKHQNNRQLIWDPPLELKDDTWVLREDGDVKFVFSRWLVKLMGPGPFAGGWSEEKSGLWKFEFKAGERASFVSSEGEWFYKGEQRPEFDMHENLWFFTGDQFELFFSAQEQNFVRLKCVKKELHLCKNSSFAKGKEKSMFESFDKELTFSKEAQKFENMEGESSTETIDQSPMKGKTQLPADQLKDLTGKSLKTSGEREDQGEGLKGKGETSHISTYWEGKLGASEEKEKIEKEKSEETINTKDNHLMGKLDPKDASSQDDFKVDLDEAKDSSLLDLEADNEFQKYYKNHNEAKQYGTYDFNKARAGKKDPDEKEDLLPLVSLEEESENEIFSKTDDVTGEFKVICYIIFSGQRIKCNLYDFFDDLIIYLAHKAAIRESNRVDLDMMFSFKDDKASLKMMGDVVSIEKDGEGSLFVSVKISPQDVTEFEAFMKHYQKKQGQVTKFIHKSKGVA
jgi:hypothetical protein